MSYYHATGSVASRCSLARTLELSYAFILMEYTPRGNLLTVPMIEYRHTHLATLAEGGSTARHPGKRHTRPRPADRSRRLECLTVGRKLG